MKHQPLSPLRVALAALSCAALSARGDNITNLTLKASTDKANPIDYEVGETIRFDFRLDGVTNLPAEAASVAPLHVIWTRTGDDGLKTKGTNDISLAQGFSMETSLSVPGFVRVEAYLAKSNYGKFSYTDSDGQSANITFEGGAGVDTRKMRLSTVEPADFDAFWAEAKAKLATVPFDDTNVELVDVTPSGTRNYFTIYAAKIPCYGPRPVTGWLMIPKNAPAGSLPVQATFDGYGCITAAPKAPTWGYEGQIRFAVNAHGYDLVGRDNQYYKDFYDSINKTGRPIDPSYTTTTVRYGYALAPSDYDNPTNTYFYYMAMRVMRAFEYLKSRPEWDGQTVIAEGGSQGGLQTMWAGGLVEGISQIKPAATWGCDIGNYHNKTGPFLSNTWGIPNVPGAYYFDAALHARRIPETCTASLTRIGLGDTTCPPRGVLLSFYHMGCQATAKLVQGSTHGYVPPNPNQTFTISKEAGVSIRADSSWSVLPVFGGGYVQNVVIAPSNPSRWYTYVDVGGPYRSDDGGRSWKPLHALMPVGQRAIWADHVRALSVDPRNADKFVMAAGDSFNKPAGVFVTTDGGQTFRQTLTARFYGDGNTRWMGQCMARHPTNPNILYCGEDWDGIYRSDDNGETWRNLGLTQKLITDIRIDPNTPNTIYVCATGQTPGRQDPSASSHVRGKGFFRSTDGGTTWHQSPTNAVPSETAQIAGSQRIVGLFNNRRILASDDGGDTWVPFETGLSILSDDAAAPGYTDTKRYQALAAGPDFWLVGNAHGDIFRRGVNENTWRKVTRTSVSLGDPVAEHHLAPRAANGEFWCLASINIDPRDPDHWLATDWFEIWETTDAGKTWTSRVNGISQLVPFTIACDPHSSTNILYGFADLGLSASHDGGKSFHSIYTACSAYANSISWSALTPGLAYCIGGKSGVPFKRTRNGGRTWQTPAKSGLPAFREGSPVVSTNEIAAYTVAVDPTTDDVYLCVSGPSGPNGGGVWKSSDQGDSFSRVSDGLPEGINLFKSSEFEGGGEGGWGPQLVFSPDGSAVLSTYGGTCYTLERGDAPGWVPTTSITNAACLRTIAADPFTPGRFLCAQGTNLLESADGGRSWHRLQAIGWQSSSCVAFDAHSPGLVVGAGKNAITVSVDGGRTFSELEDGLDYPTGVRRYVAVDRGRLFGLTRGSGVWVCQLPPTLALSSLSAPGFAWTNGTATVSVSASASESVPAGSKLRMTVLAADGTVLGTADQDWIGSGEYAFDTASVVSGAVMGDGIDYTLSFTILDTNGVEIVQGPSKSPLRLGSQADWFLADPATDTVSGGEWVGEAPAILPSGLYDTGDGAAFAALQDCTGAIARAEVMLYGFGYASTNALSTNLQYAVENGARAGLAAVSASGYEVILHGLVDENGAVVWKPLEDRVPLPFDGDFIRGAIELDTASAQPVVSYFVFRDGEWERLHDASGAEWFAAPGSGDRIAGRLDFLGRRVGDIAGYRIDKAVAEANGVRYDSLADAMAAGAVTLLTNAEIPPDAPVGLTSIDRDGHTLLQGGVAVEGDSVVVESGIVAVTGGGAIHVTLGDLSAFGIATAGRTAAQIAAALAETGANGIAKWESYVLGLDPASITSLPLAGIEVDGATDMVSVSANGLEIRESAGATVTYRAYRVADLGDRSKDEPIGEEKVPGEPVVLDMGNADTAFFCIKVFIGL